MLPNVFQNSFFFFFAFASFLSFLDNRTLLAYLETRSQDTLPQTQFPIPQGS